MLTPVNCNSCSDRALRVCNAIVQGSGGGGGLPQWLVSVIIMSSCAALSLLMLIVNRVIRYFQLRSAGEYC